MNNSINTLLNSLSKIGEIRKAVKNNGEYSSTSDNTMAVGSKRRIYRYFPTSKRELQEIIVQRILEENYNYKCNLNDINISNVGTDLSELFYWNDEEAFWSEQYEQNKINICYFNGNISDWDVSNVKDMSEMFSDCNQFNQDISSWDVHNVERMTCMFANCWVFCQNISNWDVSNVKYFDEIFNGADDLPIEYMPPKFRKSF